MLTPLCGILQVIPAVRNLDLGSPKKAEMIFLCTQFSVALYLGSHQSRQPAAVFAVFTQVAQRHHSLGLQRKCLMTWLQDTQQSLREKMSRAEDFNSHMLLRWGFRNWLKVGLHHSEETILRELAAATLSCNHSANSLTCSTTFAKLCYLPIPATLFPFSKTFSQLLTLHNSLPH